MLGQIPFFDPPVPRFVVHPVRVPGLRLKSTPHGVFTDAERCRVKAERISSTDPMVKRVS